MICSSGPYKIEELVEQVNPTGSYGTGVILGLGFALTVCSTTAESMEAETVLSEDLLRASGGEKEKSATPCTVGQHRIRLVSQLEEC